MEGTIPRHVPRCALLPKREDRATDVAGRLPAETNPADRQDSRYNGAGYFPGASSVMHDAEPEERLAERCAGSHGPWINRDDGQRLHDGNSRLRCADGCTRRDRRDGKRPVIMNTTEHKFQRARAQVVENGGPGQSRTADQRFRKPLLYPSE